MNNIPQITQPISQKKQLRRAQPKTIAGVCTGISNYFAIRSLWVKIAFTVLAMVDGIGLLCYAAAWLLLPTTDQTNSPYRKQERIKNLVGATMLAIGFLTFERNSHLLTIQPDTSIFNIEPNIWSFGEFILPATFLGVGVLLLARSDHRGKAAEEHRDGPDSATTVAQTEPPAVNQKHTEPVMKEPTKTREFPHVTKQRMQTVATVIQRRRNWRHAFIGVGGFLLGLGMLAVLADHFIPQLKHWDTAFAATVILTGTTIIIRSFFSRATGFVIIGLLFAATSCSVAAINLSLDKLGKSNATSTTVLFAAKDKEKFYDRPVGDLTVRVNVDKEKKLARLNLSLGIGKLTVFVPADFEIHTNANAGIGKIILPNHYEKHKVGSNLYEFITPSRTPKPQRALFLNANVAVGDIIVKQLPAHSPDQKVKRQAEPEHPKHQRDTTYRTHKKQSKKKGSR